MFSLSSFFSCKLLGRGIREFVDGATAQAESWAAIYKTEEMIRILFQPREWFDTEVFENARVHKKLR